MVVREKIPYLFADKHAIIFRIVDDEGLMIMNSQCNRKKNDNNINTGSNRAGGCWFLLD